MDRERKLLQLIERFEGLVNKYARFDDLALKFINARGPLFKAELHLLKRVKEHPDANVTNLASLLGVTKGAVSQGLAKLERKKLVSRAGRNRKALSFALTGDGEAVYRAHEEFHRGHFRELLKAMKRLPASRIVFIDFLFREIDSFYDVFEKRMLADKRVSVTRK